MIGYYCLLDTLHSRSIRSVFNLETKPMPSLYAASGRDMSLRSSQANIAKLKFNYANKIYCMQTNKQEDYKKEFTINIISGSINAGKDKTYPYTGGHKEVQEEHLVASLKKTTTEIEIDGAGFARQRFFISDRHKPANQQPLTDLKNGPLYNCSELNWNIMCIRAAFLDDISLCTYSRDGKFSFAFPHEHKECSGALVKKHPSNKRSDLFETTLL